MSTIPILMYHSISDDAGRKFKKFTLAPELFNAHMEYLYSNSYTVITICQLVNVLLSDEKQLPEKPVVITFDDGFYDFYTSAFPILNKYSFPATLFLVTGLLGKTSRWLKSEGEENRKMLEWSQVKEMDLFGIECGAHTQTHIDLDIADHETVYTEISNSKLILEEKLGHLVSSFSYPYGHFNDHVREIVKEAGYMAACAVRNAQSGPRDNRFSLARITVDNKTDAPRLANLLNGKGLSILKDKEKLITKAWRQFRRFRKILVSNTVDNRE